MVSAWISEARITATSTGFESSTSLHDQQRGYHFRGELALDRLIEGETRQLVPSWWPQRDSTTMQVRSNLSSKAWL